MSKRQGTNAFTVWSYSRISVRSLAFLAFLLAHLCLFSVAKANKRHRDSLFGLGTLPLGAAQTPVVAAGVPAAAALPVAPSVSVSAPVASSPIVAASAPVVAASAPIAASPVVAAPAPVVAASAPMVAASAPMAAASSPLVAASSPVVATQSIASSVPVAAAPSVIGSVSSPLASSIVAPSGTTRTVHEEYSSTGGIVSPYAGRRLTKQSSASYAQMRDLQSSPDARQLLQEKHQNNGDTDKIKDDNKIHREGADAPTTTLETPKRGLHGFHPGYGFGDIEYLGKGFIVTRGEIFEENPCHPQLPCPQPPIPDVSTSTSTAVLPTSTAPSPTPSTTSTTTTTTITTTTTASTKQNVTMLALAVKAPGDVNAQDLQTAALKGMLKKLNSGDTQAANGGTSETAGFSVAETDTAKSDFAAYSLPTAQEGSPATIATSSSTVPPPSKFFPIRLPEDGDYTFYTLLFKPNENQRSVVAAQVKGTADGSVTIQLPNTVFKTSPFTLLEGSDQTTVTNDKQELARLLPIQQGQHRALFFKLPDDTRVAFIDQRYLTLPNSEEGKVIDVPYEEKQSGSANNLSEFFASLVSKAKPSNSPAVRGSVKL